MGEFQQQDDDPHHATSKNKTTGEKDISISNNTQIIKLGDIVRYSGRPGST